MTILGALKVDNREELDKILDLQTQRDPSEITDLGVLLSKLPLSPKFSKMLVVAIKKQVCRFMIMIVACLSV